MLIAATERIGPQLLRLSGVSSRRVDTPRGRVHVLSADGKGSLPPVVLIHGLSSAALHYYPLVRHLLPEVRRVVAPDLPGHGASDPPRGGINHDSVKDGLVAALDQAQAEPAIVFGSSLGGFAAVRYALARPEKVLGLVLCSPAGAPMAPDALSTFLGGFAMKRHTDALAFVDKVFATRPALRPALAWGVKRKFRHPHMVELLGSLASEHLLRAEELARLTMPVFLIWGGQERVLPEASKDFWLRHLPKSARVESPDHYGHTPYLEDPREVAARIVSFARSC